MNQGRMIRILLQTTIPAVDDGWSIRRYSILRDYLASLENARGEPLFAVTARDREPDARGHDPLLCGLADSAFDEIWLFAADNGSGLSGEECAGITAFRQRGGGILATRDHQDAGSSICSLGGVGAAHYFHTRNQDPDVSRHCVDDTETGTISWPITTPGGTAITSASSPLNRFTTCCGVPTPRRNSSSSSQLTRTKAEWARRKGKQVPASLPWERAG